MSKNTTSKGDIGELEIALALIRAGYSILRPLSTGLRYDLAIDNRDGTFVRIQCKSGILRDGFIEFNVASADGRRPNGVPYTGQIDAFGVFCPQNGNAYLVPIERLAARASKGRLRVDAARNGQVRGITFAEPFEVVCLAGHRRAQQR